MSHGQNVKVKTILCIKMGYLIPSIGLSWFIKIFRIKMAMWWYIPFSETPIKKWDSHPSHPPI